MTPQRRRFEGLHVAVTGAGTGIGRAIALRLASEGASLSLLARDRTRLEKVALEIAAAGGVPARAFACDQRDAAWVEHAFGECARQGGELYALVANSGIGGGNTPGAQDRFEELVQTNLVGTYRCLRAAQQHLLPGPRTRHLLAIASILARLGVGGYSGYCASKAGLLGLVRSLAVELAPQNVQVNALLPGWVETEMAQSGIAEMARGMNTSTEQARKIALSAVPLRRMGQPEEVAGIVAWLISDDARGVTGASIDANNGALMS
ncbi:MAG: SDR family oxidoreductase [Planctomycetes bacterium]|nr:SDR family oxidoreductase [Planctomycetota bacterium]